MYAEKQIQPLLYLSGYGGLVCDGASGRWVSRMSRRISFMFSEIT